jgi:CMP-2-keto-3-deoxyoctulosonic acid synthetase
MVVRVATRQAMKIDATQTVAADSAAIVSLRWCGVRAILTRADHVSGGSRLAEPTC